MTSTSLLVVAGEASGDQRAAGLVRALSAQVPDLAPFGLGADGLRDAGVDLVGDSGEIAVVGIAEVIDVLPRAAELFGALLAEVERRRPRAAVLVDFPDFNLRLARELAWRGVPVVYYVSPQIWAWRRGRVRTLADTVARMLVLFPFEVPFYERHGVPVTHVGHPLVDEVPPLAQAWDSLRPGALPERFRIALLPGSRRSEIRALLPILLESARRIGDELPVEVVVAQAPTLDAELLAGPLQRSGLEGRVVADRRLEAIAESHLALCASGTATLETGLLRTPMLVCYRVSPWTFGLARLLVRVPHVSLVNLVLERRAVPEMIQRQAAPERIAHVALRLLESRRDLDLMRRDLGELRARLGAPGASERAAREVARLLERSEAA